MFKNLSKFIIDEVTLDFAPSAETSELHAALAVAVLLSQAAMADGVVNAHEFGILVGLVVKTFSLSPEEALQLLAVADRLIKKPSRVEAFCKELRCGLNEDQKLKLISMVWRVILADESANKPEAATAARLRALLGLSMEEAVLARRVAESATA